MFSIKTIFKAWKSNSTLLFIFLFVLALITAGEYFSHSKVHNLQLQKMLTSEIASLSRDDLEFSNIQFRGKSVQIQLEIDKLQELHGYDYFGMMLDQSEPYNDAITELRARASAFSNAAESWFESSTKNLKKREQDLLNTKYAFYNQVSAMIEQDSLFSYDKFFIYQFIVYAAFLHALMILMVHGGQFQKIYKDIESLFAVDVEGDYTIATEEVESISKRMGRKPPATTNPAMVEPITELLNKKGLLHAFAAKAVPKEGSSSKTMVCVFQVDELSELSKQYPKEFMRNVLKKIAFMTSLYKQHSDIIAHVASGQFVLVVTRTEAKTAFEECEQIRESIAETNFKIPKGGSINITVSGGFSEKSGGKSFDETLTEATNYMEGAQLTGGNKIMKNRVK